MTLFLQALNLIFFTTLGDKNLTKMKILNRNTDDIMVKPKNKISVKSIVKVGCM